MKYFLQIAFLTVVLGLVFSTPAAAIPTYTASFQGVTFTVQALDTNTLTLRIQGAESTTNADWAPAVSISGFSFKDIGSLGSATVSAGPGLGNWTYMQDELSANACTTAAGAGTTTKHCFMAVPPVALTDDMQWTIDYGQGAFSIASSGPHLKVRFLDGDGKKQGSLLSDDGKFTLSDTPPPPTTTPVPEPSSVILLGSALMGLGLLRRRFGKI